MENRIDLKQRAYVHHEPLVYDSLGRLLIYDTAYLAIQNKSSLVKTLITYGAYYMTYGSYYADPYIAYKFYMWSGLSSLLTMGILGKRIEKS